MSRESCRLVRFIHYLGRLGMAGQTLLHSYYLKYTSHKHTQLSEMRAVTWWVDMSVE